MGLKNSFTRRHKVTGQIQPQNRRPKSSTRAMATTMLSTARG